MKRTVEYLGKSEDGFAEYEISESIENDSTSKVYKPEKIKYPRPEAQAELSSKKGILKLNKEEFLKTEFGRDLRNTVDLLDRAIKMQNKCSNKGDWDEFKLHSQRIEELDNRCEVFKLAIKQFYGLEYDFRRTDEHYGFCTEDESDWLFKIELKMDGKGENIFGATC